MLKEQAGIDTLVIRETLYVVPRQTDRIMVEDHALVENELMENFKRELRKGMKDIFDPFYATYQTLTPENWSAAQQDYSDAINRSNKLYAQMLSELLKILPESEDDANAYFQTEQASRTHRYLQMLSSGQ